MWQKVFDFCFPPSESFRLVRSYPQSNLSDYYHELHIGTIITLSSYRAPLIKACVTAGKFEYNRYALTLLGTLLATYVERHPQHGVIFVPIPLHISRTQKRGYNQVTEIINAALHIHQEAGRVMPLLKRIKATPAQSHLGRADRLKNLTDAFAYRTTSINWNTVTEIILVDDVLTTGATLEAATRALQPHLPPHVQLTRLAITH
jgi:predicted amidophosphoribosyltransferase